MLNFMHWIPIELSSYATYVAEVGGYRFTVQPSPDFAPAFVRAGYDMERTIEFQFAYTVRIDEPQKDSVWYKMEDGLGSWKETTGARSERVYALTLCYDDVRLFQRQKPQPDAFEQLRKALHFIANAALKRNQHIAIRQNLLNASKAVDENLTAIMQK